MPIDHRERAFEEATEHPSAALVTQGPNLLGEYRSALISAALTGKIDVREARIK